MSIARKIISRFPAGTFARQLYNKRRIDFYSGHYMKDEEIMACENDDNVKHSMLEKYERKQSNVVRKNREASNALIARSPSYKDRQNNKKLKDEMLFCKLAYGFEPDEFLCYGLESKSPEERKAYVSDRELMSDVYRMNDRIDIQIFNDKANTYLYFKPFYKREALIIRERGDIRQYYEYTKKYPVFVKKMVGEAMGRSVELIDLRKNGVNPERIFDTMVAQGKHLLEEKVEQSSMMSALNESSVNTVRFITYNTRDGIIIPYSFMKIGRKGSFVDNGGAGGILVGIDQSTGRLNTDGFDEFTTRYPAHPDSNIVFKGYQLPEFDKAVAMAKKLSQMTPTVKFIGWDFAYTDNGWVIIEGNGMSQLIGPQIVFEHGMKSEIEMIKRTMTLYDWGRTER